MTNITDIEQQLNNLNAKVALLKEEHEQKYVLTKSEMTQLIKNINSIFLEKLDESIRNINFDNHFEIEVLDYGTSIELRKDIDEEAIADDITNSIDFVNTGDDEILQTVDNELKCIRYKIDNMDMTESFCELAKRWEVK